MAGNGKRFVDEGYKTPKALLNINGKTLFQRAVLTFKTFFNEEDFVFLYRTDIYNKDNLSKQLTSIGLFDKCQYQGFNTVTKGQAHTIYEYTNYLNNNLTDPLIIFNIDTFYQLPDEGNHFKFYLNRQSFIDTFLADGDHWSFVISDNGIVKKVAEKKRISDQCSTGLYGFSSIESFNRCYRNYHEDYGSMEHYIMPLYNLLMQKEIVYENPVLSNQVIVCGTPKEYEAIK